jgi:hypothetical protein
MYGSCAALPRAGGGGRARRMGFSFKVLWKLSKVVGLTERNPEEPAAGRTATAECVT